MSNLLTRYQDYLQRHATYFPTEPQLTLSEYNELELEWDRDYKQLWEGINQWITRNEFCFDFQRAPQWPQIKSLERRMCV